MRKIKAFTMIEILIITIIVSIWLLSIVFAVSKAKTMTNSIIQNMIANQLAKEWVEMVYQIRNTNILQHTTQKNMCWLNLNPYIECDWIQKRMSTWSYIITTWNILSWVNDDLDLSWWLVWNQVFAICLSWWQRNSCPWEDNQTKHWKFFRTIEWKWLFNKDNLNTWGIELNCLDWNPTECIDTTAKEYRFCSRVEYIWTNIWKTEICSIITNFFD